MKLSALSCVLWASAAQAHYRFSRLYLDGKIEANEWTSVRTTKNWKDVNPTWFNNASTNDIRCYQLPSKTTPGVATITAGNDVGFVSWPTPVFHDGAIQFYMAKVPEGKDVTTWEPEGEVWFKIGYLGHKMATGEIIWPHYYPHKQQIINVTIPKEVPSGDYLLRIEQVGYNTGDLKTGLDPLQWYLSCAQVRIINGGNGNPAQRIALPGPAYAPDIEGLNIPIFYNKPYYHPPGPPVWPSNVTGYDGTAAGVPGAPA